MSEEKKVKNVKTQKSEVLKFMQKYEYITQMIATERFGATRLSDIIFRLRKEGYEIGTRTVTKKNRYGHTTNYAEYYLVD